MDILAMIAKGRMRLAFVMEAYHRHLIPEQIHESRIKCEERQDEDWYKLLGAALDDD